MLTDRGGAATWVGKVPTDLAESVTAAGDSLAALRDALALLHTERIPGYRRSTADLWAW